jgi:hypothetical protein
VTDDILDEARSQVLDGGAGLDAGQVLRCLQLPDDRGNYLSTLGRPARADLEMLSRLRMPIKALSGTI